MLRILKYVFSYSSAFIGGIFILVVRLYQLIISPLFPPTCRFTPSCSSYAMEAFRIWGPFKGFYLTLKRLLRCHPWGACGHDPVPKKGIDNSPF